MTYSSTVTSKGTITLPASIRRQLGITEGKKVTIRQSGDKIEVVPQSGWEEFFAMTEQIGRKVRHDIAAGKIKPLLTNEEIQNAVSKARADGVF